MPGFSFTGKTFIRIGTRGGIRPEARRSFSVLLGSGLAHVQIEWVGVPSSPRRHPSEGWDPDLSYPGMFGPLAHDANHAGPGRSIGMLRYGPA